MANGLGNILASEEFCGLTYDLDAIATFIEQTVPADDMKFASTLDLMTRGNKAQIAEMSPASKAAHCAQIKRVARSFNFIQ